ncbi:MAG: hydantoinase/oxoprolinase family protein [Desulfobacterales bacterium]
MSLLLGIDTGGTYTDAVLFDDKQGVIGSAKALTTKFDLAVGIREAIAAVLPPSPGDIRLVSLSTTLATNAVVEGQGCAVALLLIGYDRQLMVNSEIERIVSPSATFYIRGGHNSTGQEIAPLDLEAAKEKIRAIAPQVEAFAISGYFGVRNPSHELQVRKQVRELTGKPVTCGHELTSQLHAPRRAMTVAMNARLVPLLDELISTVRNMLAEKAIDAPLMVVKGDGSLVDAEMALERPVETILSGPAASVVGASFLADVEDAFVVDMGGTTTDIAVMEKGRPVLDPDGARIDGWQIMIEAIDARTTGLGGDSNIGLDGAGRLFVGPRRVIPLCLLAEKHPDILEVLQHQVAELLNPGSEVDGSDFGRFVLQQRRRASGTADLSDMQEEIWRRLEDGPVSLATLIAGATYPPIFRRALDDLITRGLVVSSAFTPTDALHVLGQYRCWSVPAAEKGAAIWAAKLKMEITPFCEKTVGQVQTQMGRAIIDSALAAEKQVSPENEADAGSFLINRALGVNGSGTFSLSFTLNRSLVAIGAPAVSYMPEVSRVLGASLSIPEHAEIDNALGAAVAGIVQTVRVLIQAVDEGSTFKVHLPFGVKDFPELEAAVACAEKEAQQVANDRAQQAGANEIQVTVERQDRIVAAPDDVSGDIYIDTEVVATAIGRPRMA